MTTRSNATLIKILSDFWTYDAPGTAYRCLLNVIPEREGGHSAICANLPGVADGGDTEQQAIARACEAFRLAVEVYKESGKAIPWRKRPLKSPRRGRQVSITVVVKPEDDA